MDKLSTEKDQTVILWGGNIRKAREAAGLTQGEMAEKMGKSITTVNRYEKGHRIPDADFLNRVVKITGCNGAWLLTGEGDLKGGPHGDIQAIDRDLLISVIETIEKGLLEVNVDLIPEKKADLLITLYEMFKSEKNIDKITVLRLIKLAG